MFDTDEEKKKGRGETPPKKTQHTHTKRKKEIGTLTFYVFDDDKSSKHSTVRPDSQRHDTTAAPKQKRERTRRSCRYP